MPHKSSIQKLSNLPLLVLAILIVVSCNKWEDKPGQDDPRLARKYCNIPEAVNFNWDFPGTEDSTVCIFPSDVFAGNYTFYDTAYNEVDSAIALRNFNGAFTAIDRSKFRLSGFCSAGQSLQLTANRYFSSSIDTLIPNGQLFCRTQDTISGIIYRKVEDTLFYNLNVYSDTGRSAHRGTAVKQ